MAPRGSENGEWERLLESAQARFRTQLRSEGLDPDTMTEDEKMDYVNRAIHECRAEQATGSAETGNR